MTGGAWQAVGLRLLAVVCLAGCRGEIRFEEVSPGGEAGAADPAGAGVVARDAEVVDAAAVDAAVDAPAAQATGDAPVAVPDAPVAAVVDAQTAAVVDAPLAALDAPAEAAPPVDAGDCPVGLCGWIPPCEGDGCNVVCSSRTTCAGHCGARCTAVCRDNSTCAVATGSAADLECGEESSCRFAVVTGRVTCHESRSCDVRCLGACTVTCEETTCRLQCAGDAEGRMLRDETARCE